MRNDPGTDGQSRGNGVDTGGRDEDAEIRESGVGGRAVAERYATGCRTGGDPRACASHLPALAAPVRALRARVRAGRNAGYLKCLTSSP